MAGSQCRLKGPKFRSDIQGDARKSTHDFLSLSFCNAFPYRGTSNYSVFVTPQQSFVSGRGENIPLQARPPRHKATQWNKGKKPGLMGPGLSCLSGRGEK